jgi:cytochrome c
VKGITVLVVAAGVGLGWSLATQAQDAEAVIKKGGCLKCHSVSADKDGPSFKKTAAKYKGQANAAATLETQLKTGVVKVGGKDEKHAVLKASDAEIKSAVAYILSR